MTAINYDYCTKCGRPKTQPEYSTSLVLLCNCSKTKENTIPIYYNPNKVYVGTLFGIQIYVNTMEEYKILIRKLNEVLTVVGLEYLDK